MRLLLIEDDARVARFIENGLSAEGYRIDIADNGQHGVDMAKALAYDIILLDVKLPVMNGFDVCQRLRECGMQTPILMLSAMDTLEDKVRGFELGVDDYLTKPFAFEELLLRIRALLRRGKKLDYMAVHQVDDLVLDTNVHEVRRADKLIKVTPKEFALLEYFMKRPNRVLSRTMIEDQVWGNQQDSLTNIVDVYIRRLRKKIDEGFDPQLIQTVRGIGYRLKAEVS